MKKKKILPVFLLLLLIFALGAAWLLMNYHIVDFRLYSKHTDSLDLRGKEISTEHYEKLREKLPDAVIRWDVPFQNGRYSDDTKEIAVTSLSDADVEMLRYFSQLESLDARQCQDAAQLMAVKTAYPELTLYCDVALNGQIYPQDVNEITLHSITDEELTMLSCLTELTTVTVTDQGDGAGLEKLRHYCKENGIGFQVSVNGQVLQDAGKELTISNVTDTQVQLLMLMDGLESLYLPEPEAKAESLKALEQKLPNTAVTWEKTVLGMTFRSDAMEIDLTDAISRAEGESPETKTAYEYALECEVFGVREEELSSAKVQQSHPLPDKSESTPQLLEEVEAAMEYFPHAEKLVMCGAWLQNTAMSEFRDTHREDYKVVWSVQCGDLATRTDATLFMPTKFQIQMKHFSDLDAYNLRYCEDMVAIDLGHMVITNLDFVAFMPQLTYLVLSWTYVKDLTPISSCKNLVFFEMNWVDRVTDYSPLVACTALEDLNIGQTNGDITPILQMTWLKNLWIVGCQDGSYEKTVEALPDTNIGYFFSDPVIGWRNLPNYYAMRDALFMYYMQ